MSDQSNEAGRAEAQRLAGLTDEQLIAEVASQQSGLPQSQLGGLHPELLARITAAAAVVTDFYRDDSGYYSNPAPEIPSPDYESWAGRLAAELSSLLDVIQRHPS